MKGEELCHLILEGLLIAEDSRLVMQDSAHVDAKGPHILGDEDLVLLGLIPVCIKTGSEVLHLVL